MHYCLSCGTELKGNELFCPACGYKITAEEKTGFLKNLKEWITHSLGDTKKSENERLTARDLESQLKIEREKSNNLEIDLGITNRVLAEKENKIKRLNVHISLLDRELKSTLETCILSYLKEHNGIISIKEYANQLKVREDRIKEALETLKKKGKIKIPQH